MSFQEKLTTTLNEPQRKAVLHTEGPLLVIAGAGSGKTRVITYRIQNLIHTGVNPKNILAVTFTNKAAAEMRERVAVMLRDDPSSDTPLGLPHISTFHSLGVLILREYGHLIGLKKRFTILDQSDARSIIKKAITDSGYDVKQLEPKKVLGAISRAKGEGLTQTRYAAESQNDFFPSMVSEVWEKYERALKEEGALDFDDLLLKSVLLIEQYIEVRKALQDRFRYVHVDEYQDTNNIQHRLTGLIVGDAHNICVVGDIDQNIYSWRGARIANMMQFERHYPGVTIIPLEQNYRSTKTIVAASNEIISKNTQRPEKHVFTDNTDGEKISLYGAYDENDEAQFVAGKVQELIREGVSPKDIAVLYRANFLSRVLEEWFLSYELPYHILGVRFFDRKEIKDIVSFIKLAENRDSVSDLSRVINVPPRGIGKTTLLKLIQGQRETLTPAMGKRVDTFYAMLDEIAKACNEKLPSQVIKSVIALSGIEEALKKGGDEEQERLENIQELVTLAKKYDALGPREGLDGFLENVALRSDQDDISDERDAVRLMTVHAAKGLEFPYVFIVGLETGLFPHERMESDRTDTEEERRLFYVALTRAEKKVFLSFASTRMLFGSRVMNVPSEFVTDIDENLIDVEGVRESRGLLDDVDDDETVFID